LILRRTLLLLVLVLSFVGTSVMLLPVSSVKAASSTFCSDEGPSFLDFPTWYKFIDHQFTDPDGGGPRTEECVLTFPPDSNGEPSIFLALPRILLAVFEIVLRVAGLAAVAFVIYGGIRYILSQGEPEGTKNAKNTILNSLIGLAIVMTATAIVNLIGSSIT
jgi:hypothetical protein